MRILIREYLESLKESGEFDVIFLDLLRELGLVPLAKPQVGARQQGVDVAAVGDGGDGRKTLWLFVLKQGDIGRIEWNSGAQSVRQSLDDVRDVYIRSNVSAAHNSLPVKIVVATTGELRQVVEQQFAGYVADNSKKNKRSYDFWHGDRVAELIEEHLLHEYALPATARSQLRRALALVGERDYGLEHYFALLEDLFSWDAHKPLTAPKRKKAIVRSLLTASLALGILCRWAARENNLRSALIGCERTLLCAWDAIRKHELTKDRAIAQRMFRLLVQYFDTGVEYFNKVEPHLHHDNALARYFREAALMNERVFEELGFLGTLGLGLYFLGMSLKDEAKVKGANAIGETLHAFLQTHHMCGSPGYDSHAIELSLGLLLLHLTRRDEAARDWLRELAGRLTYAFRSGKWFPISTDSFDDLVALEIDKNDVDMKKLTEMSWMIPTLCQWCAVLGADEAYTALAGLRNDVLRETHFQLWYPDEHTDAVAYRGPAHLESGISEAPVKLPDTAEGMRAVIRRTLSESPVKDHVMSSAAKSGLVFLDFIASRHFRTPVNPAFWQLLLTQAVAVEGEGPVKEGPSAAAPDTASRAKRVGKTPPPAKKRRGAVRAQRRARRSK